MRAWVKTSPLTDKEHYRERILNSAIERVRSERKKNISKLRNGHEDFDGLARLILCTAMSSDSVSSPVPSSFASPSSSSLKLEKYSQNEKYFERTVQDALNSCDEDILESEFGHQKYDEEVGLITILGSEDHQLLMDQIAEELKAEYYSDINNSELSLFENTEKNEDYDWSQIENDSNDARSIICPVCRVSQMEIVDTSGKCSCGTFLLLRDERTGETISPNMLKNMLADVYDRHILVCDYDVSISPLPLDCSRDHSGASTPANFEHKYDPKNSPKNDAKYDPRYSPKYDPTFHPIFHPNSHPFHPNNHPNFHPTHPTFHPKNSPINDHKSSPRFELYLDHPNIVNEMEEFRCPKGLLEFSQRDHVHLSAMCKYCGFDEMIL